MPDMESADPRVSFEAQDASRNPLERYAGVEQKLGFWSAVLSLSLSMVGVGVVSFPYAIASCGYVEGPAVFFLISILSYFSYTALINCTSKSKVSSWGDLLQGLPPAWGIYANISLVVMLVLATSAYIIIATNVINSAAKSVVSDFIVKNEVVFAIMLFIMLPLVLAKSLEGLSKLANCCTGILCVVVVGIIYECCRICKLDPPSSVDTPIPFNSSLLLAVPIFAGAGFGHMNMPQIYAELKPELKPKAHRVAFVAVFGCMLLYWTIGLFGYFAFGTAVGSDVVKQIADHEGETPVVATIHACLASFIILKCPLIVLPARSVLLVLCGKCPEEISTPNHIMVTVGILGLVYLGAIALPQLNLILEFLGSSVTIPVCFIVPARLSWKLEVPARTGLLIVMVFFGVVATVLSFIETVHDIVDTIGK